MTKFLVLLMVCASAGAQQQTYCNGRVKAVTFVRQSTANGRPYVEYGVTLTNLGVKDTIYVSMRETLTTRPLSTITRPNPHYATMDKGAVHTEILMTTVFPGADTSAKLTAAQILSNMGVSCRIGDGTGDPFANW